MTSGSPAGAPSVDFVLDGRNVDVVATGSLLDALRGLGARSAKDGCGPQGQCGCCTVWVDGQPRVACVTPVVRVAGRSVTTVDGLPDADGWARRFTSAGASQCGFCTPGIIMRLAALDGSQRASPDAVRRALLAHLCRCTGWQPIVEAVTAPLPDMRDQVASPSGRAVARAALEGGVPQDVGPHVALGRGGFAADTAPAEALVAVRRAEGAATGSLDDPTDAWVVGDDLISARAASGKVQGRRSTAALRWPLDVPDGDWAITLQTTWVEPAYLEPDSSWCIPGGEPARVLGNGGAFGGKADSPLGAAARALADRHGRAVCAVWSREDVVRYGPKRPPLSIGMRADGSAVVRVVRTEGIVDSVRAVSPDVEVHEVDVPGPPSSTRLRGVGWLELAIVRAALDAGPGDAPVHRVTSPSGAEATAWIDADGAVHVTVRCGADPGDADELTVLRSYCTGAAHMALGWVRSEAIAVDDDGRPQDLTIRSFGVLRAVDVPPLHVDVLAGGPLASPTDAVNGSDAVLAAVAAAAWRHDGLAPRWPVGRASR